MATVNEISPLSTAVRAGVDAVGEELTDLFQDYLALCDLNESETLALAYTTDSRPEYVLAVRGAVARIGARLIELPIASQMTVRAPSILRGMGGTATLDGASLERIKAADILFDITAEGLLWSPALGEVLASGTRTVMAIDPPEALQRMFPSQELKLRALANGERLGRAKTLRVVSDAGTDLTCELGQYAARARYGFSDEAGHWDHWPSGMVATFPNDGTPEGVIVANEGDVPLPFSRYLSAPVRFVFEKGILTSIEGGFDARLIRDFIDSWHDPRGYDFSHLGWGLQRRANWAAIALFEGERMMCQDIRTFEGNFLFSTGPNEVAGRFTPCHLDIACRDVTLLLDDEVIVENGVVKPESLQ